MAANRRIAMSNVVCLMDEDTQYNFFTKLPIQTWCNLCRVTLLHTPHLIAAPSLWIERVWNAYFSVGNSWKDDSTKTPSIGLNDCFWLKVEPQKERTDGAASEKTDNDLHLDGSQLAFDGPDKLFQHHSRSPSPRLLPLLRILKVRKRLNRTHARKTDRRTDELLALDHNV